MLEIFFARVGDVDFQAERRAVENFGLISTIIPLFCAMFFTLSLNSKGVAPSATQSSTTQSIKGKRVIRACHVMKMGGRRQRFQPKEHQALVLG